MKTHALSIAIGGAKFLPILQHLPAMTILRLCCLKGVTFPLAPMGQETFNPNRSKSNIIK